MSLLKEKNELLNAYKKVHIINEAVPPGTPGTPGGPKKKLPTQPLPPQGAPVQPPQNVESGEEILQQAKPMIDKINSLDNTQDLQGMQTGEWSLDDLLKFAPTGEANIANFEESDLPQWGFKDLEPLISRSYITKEPLLIYGDPGIGKSSTVEYFAENIAAPSKNREFKDWRNCSIEEKTEIIKNPSKYFVLIVELVNKLEPSDFMGVPSISSDEPYLETKQLKWIYLMSLPEADGILFLDEINLGSPQILQSLYEVVLDKAAAGTRFSDDFCIMAAGNIKGMFTTNVESLPRALVDRFTAGVLIAKPEEWLDWAAKAGIDKTILAFIKSDVKGNFYSRPTGESDPFPSPRSLVKFSRKLKQIYKDYGEAFKAGKPIGTSIYRSIGLEAAAKCGTKWANKYITFLRYIQAFDIPTIIKDIKNINKKEQAELMALMTFILSKSKLAVKKLIETNPPDKTSPVYSIQDPANFEILNGIAHVFAYLDKDSSMTLWSDMRTELSLPEQGVLLEFFAKGEYDPAVKKNLLGKLPNLVKIHKGQV